MRANFLLSLQIIKVVHVLHQNSRETERITKNDVVLFYNFNNKIITHVKIIIQIFGRFKKVKTT